MAPWTLFFPSLGLFLYRHRLKLAADGLLYVMVWFTAVFVFFSIFTQKRPVYILSAYPALALLLGAWWQNLKDETPTRVADIVRQLAAYAIAVSFLLFAVALIVQVTSNELLNYLTPILRHKDQGDLLRIAGLLNQHRLAAFFWCAVSGLGGIFLAFAVKNDKWSAYFGCTVLVMVVSFTYVQRIDDQLASEYTFKPFIGHVAAAVKNAPLFFYRSNNYSVMFYLGRHLQRYQPELKPNGSPFFILFWENDWANTTQKTGLSVRAMSEAVDRQALEHGHLLLVEAERPEIVTLKAGSPDSGDETVYR
jgi:hypothetical protein